MSIETAVVFDYDMKPIHWHLPLGRSAVYMPDSRDLWTVLLENRDNVFGVAHSHPGRGEPQPSWTDVTTFSACELGLGKKLLWPIITADRVSFFMNLKHQHKYLYERVYLDQELFWLDKLKELSYDL